MRTDATLLSLAHHLPPNELHKLLNKKEPSATTKPDIQTAHQKMAEFQS